MKYYNSKDRIEVDYKIDYKLTEKNLSAWGMLDEMYSLYVRVLNSQKEAVDEFIRNGHHFFTVQNTIFEQNSGVPMRIPNIQGVTQNGESVVFRT